MRRKKWYIQMVHEAPHQLFCPDCHPESFRPWLDRLRSRQARACQAEGDAPLALEIGMGSGDFLLRQAEMHPECFFLGIEVKPDRIYKAYEKAEARNLKNIAFLRMEALRLPEFQLPQAQRIYLLFSDPWPKKRHIIRRLTSGLYLPLYEALLAPEGELIMKTDNRVLYEYSLESLREHGWRIVEQVEDFQTPPEEQTAYEKKFKTEGNPIYYLRATP